MAFDLTLFRTAFPEFSSSTTYPDATINGWVSLATNSPMGDWFTNATIAEDQYMIAHIGYLLTKSAAGNSVAGGAETSASEGSVSVSFAQPPIKTGLEYYLSSTTYGRALWALLLISGAGGDYIGGMPERGSYRKGGGLWT